MTKKRMKIMRRKKKYRAPAEKVGTSSSTSSSERISS